MDVGEYNQASWDKQVEAGNKWTRPVDETVIAAARRGEWHVVLTPTKPVPREWFPSNIDGQSILCLASGGGQQAPVLAAAGARVVVLDASPKQLQQDEFVAKRHGLELVTELGDMRDLSRFDDGSFDLIVHPVSNVFVESALPVWRESARVLRPGGALLSGLANPIGYIFDLRAWNEGRLVVRHRIPYSDIKDLTADELQTLILGQGEPICFGHTLHDLIQGQIDAGFVLAGFYEDKAGDGPLDAYIDSFFATRAIKMNP
jgi:SAM-dependent methyltransferase